MIAGAVIADRFIIQELAGSGGMGEVYRAYDRTGGQVVAIKVLRSDAHGDVARFEREARILSEINDPRVVRHIAHGTLASGEAYLVMEWLDGEDLGKRLSRGRLAPAESVALCVDIADALGKLHDRGIVHRDLKPSNVFLVQGRTDQVKVLDFGIAQIASSTRMTGTGTLIGTFGYMAPEQANGAKSIDARADIFALGCVLFECIAGEAAFGGQHPMAILTKILFEESPRLSERASGIPMELDVLVGRFLSKNRNDRPKQGREAADALRALGDLPQRALEQTMQAQMTRSVALTDSEQRALAVILVSAPANDVEPTNEAIEAIARVHDATIERLLDGSLALLLSGTGVVTDLAVQAARCALAVGACVTNRRVVLAMGRGHGTTSLPIGPAIDQAARLFGADTAERGIVAIDDAVVGFLDARFNVRDESGVYVLSGERDVAEVRTLLGKPTPCVGRERELRMLNGFFDDCTGDEPRAQAALVTAPPGVGKSRLGREFLQNVRMRGENPTIWMARGEPLRAGSAFSLASQLVEHAARIRSGEPLEIRRKKLQARVAETVAENHRQRITVFLGEMINTPFPDADDLPLRAARSDPQLMNDQVRMAFSDFLNAECRERTVVIFLEDLHWGDAPTVDTLNRALAELSEKRLFILALARPEIHEVFPKLWAGRTMQEIGMSELSRKASERLVKHVLGEQTSAAMVQKLVELSAGNAFYLEELIRAAADGHHDDLPDTVVSMVQSRLGGLSDSDRRHLRAASVFGETFWTSGVATLLGGMHSGAGKVDEKLRGLVEKEVFVRRSESRFPGETEYAFRHALLREGAYAMLTDEDRTLGHRLAGEWLEQKGEDDPQVLAEHFEKGGRGEKASTHWLRATDRAYRTMDSLRGIHYAHRGLACTNDPAVRIRLLGELCQLNYVVMTGLHEAKPHAEEVLRACKTGSASWAQAMLVITILAAQGGRPEQFAEVLQVIMAADIEPSAIEPGAMLIAVASYMLDLFGQIPQANAIFDKLEALTNASGSPGATSMFHVLMAAREAQAKHNPWKGFAHGQLVAQYTELIGNRRYLVASKVFMSMNAWLLGANEQAEEMLVRLDPSADEMGPASAAPAFIRTWLRADAQALDEAQKIASTLVEFGVSRTVTRDEARGRWVLAEVLRRKGEFAAAKNEIDQALEMLKRVCPGDVPGVLATLAAIHLAQGKPHDALAAAEEGVRKMESMYDTCGFFRNAFLRLHHAEALEACGRHEDARRSILQAKEWLLAVQSRVEEDNYKKSFLEGVPENRRILELANAWQ